jgi:predicted HicB family RNase H-like nuclease
MADTSNLKIYSRNGQPRTVREPAKPNISRLRMLTVRVAPELYARFQKSAAAKGMSMNNLALLAIEKAAKGGATP